MSNRIRHVANVRARVGAAATAALAALALPAPAAEAAPIARPTDPLVVSGASLGELRGSRPGDVLAFSYSKATRRWSQHPVQVDERANVDLGKVYNGTRSGITITTYTDPKTFAGPDPIITFDGNDEVAMMARNSGDRARRLGAPVAAPGGVRPATGTELAVTDPRNGARSFIYLYAKLRSSKRTPAAGRNLVTYAFSLQSGNYKATYDLVDGPNPESSTVSSPYYRVRFPDRWKGDALQIRAGAATGADILDQRNAQFSPGFCGRSVDTFADAEGAFIVNKDGPVRAIRSYIGANSGPLTQRDHFFYDRREVVDTYLRVHAIPAIMDFWDYSGQARGMTYRSSGSPGGRPVDGSPDAVSNDAPQWELLSGRQGSLTNVVRLETDVPRPHPTRSYYLDDSTPAAPRRRSAPATASPSRRAGCGGTATSRTPTPSSAPPSGSPTRGTSSTTPRASVRRRPLSAPPGSTGR